MTDLGAAVLGLGIGIGVIVAIIVLLWVVTHRLNRRTGGKGPVQRSRLTCPKCGRTFDYEWIVGASFNAVRLGSRRYLACPLCHQWSTFDVVGALVGSRPPPSG